MGVLLGACSAQAGLQESRWVGERPRAATLVSGAGLREGCSGSCPSLRERARPSRRVSTLSHHWSFTFGSGPGPSLAAFSQKSLPRGQHQRAGRKVFSPRGDEVTAGQSMGPPPRLHCAISCMRIPRAMRHCDKMTSVSKTSCSLRPVGTKGDLRNGPHARV